MLLLNFAHPLTSEQLQQLQELLQRPVERVIEVPVQFDHNRSFAEQVRELVDKIGLSAREWQTKPILINPPALNFIAVTLLAELHGRMGHFPTIIRLRPVSVEGTTTYEVAEIIDLQATRDAARKRR